jgi:hypothetical protein
LPSLAGSKRVRHSKLREIHSVHSRLFMRPLRKRQETDRGAEDNTGQCIMNDYVFFSKMFGRRSVEAGLAKSSRFPSLDSLRLDLVGCACQHARLVPKKGRASSLSSRMLFWESGQRTLTI